MVMSMKDSSGKVNLTGKESINSKMERHTVALSRRGSFMDQVLSMTHFLK